jgi:hypothetical protein
MAVVDPQAITVIFGAPSLCACFPIIISPFPVPSLCHFLPLLLAIFRVLLSLTIYKESEERGSLRERNRPFPLLDSPLSVSDVGTKAYQMPP